MNFASPKSVICTFVGHHQGLKSCSIKYGQCQQPLTVEVHNNSVEANSDSVQIFLETELKNGDCYSVNASNDTFTVLQQGLYSKSISNTIIS